MGWVCTASKSPAHENARAGTQAFALYGYLGTSMPFSCAFPKQFLDHCCDPPGPVPPLLPMRQRPRRPVTASPTQPSPPADSAPGPRLPRPAAAAPRGGARRRGQRRRRQQHRRRLVTGPRPRRPRRRRRRPRWPRGSEETASFLGVLLLRRPTWPPAVRRRRQRRRPLPRQRLPRRST